MSGCVHCLRDRYPEMFAGITTPKDEEIVASPRFENPRQHFEDLLKSTFANRKHCSNESPSSIFYAYKQQEEERFGVTSTGWETMLKAVMNAGFQIVRTWPVRTERTSGFKPEIKRLRPLCWCVHSL